MKTIKTIIDKNTCLLKEFLHISESSKENADSSTSEQKQEWSEEDEKMLDTVLGIILYNHKRQFCEGNQIYACWLNALVDKFKHCTNETFNDNADSSTSEQKSEWSKEDEETLACAISVFEDFAECKNVFVPPAEAKRYLKQLKSLRPQPKNEWSEEQMEHLKRCFSQSIDLDEFTEKMNDWKARYNHPDNIPIKATMAFTARMFYQYPNAAREWYESLPKCTDY